MSNVQYLNPKAEVLKKIQALAMNINAAMGLQDVIKATSDQRVPSKCI